MARKLSFLAASDGTPLAKSYALGDKGLEKSGYPNTYFFDSHPEAVENLPDLHRAVTKHAALGHCLLKGELQRPLRHESRAGATAPLTPTNWVCLDFDGVPGIASFADLLPHLPPHFRATSYVEQFSASAGIESSKGYSAHVFMLLESPLQPSQLKEWLTHLNLSTPILRQHIRLNNAKTVLRWPLDLTTCQNDKLLYIAPPVLGKGVVDSFEGERIIHVRKAQAKLPVDLTPIQAERNRATRTALLNELLTAVGIPERRHTEIKHPSGFLVLKDPGTARVTGVVKRERGFCYLNLNDGDSFAYYHADDKPEILRNFKGEPSYIIKDFLPDYYPQAVELANELKEIRKEAKRDTAKQAKREEKAEQLERAEETARKTGLHYIAVEDMRSSAYYRGTYDETTQQLTISEAKTERRLHAFLAQHSQPIPEHIPVWRVEHDFDSDVIFDPDNRFVNLYQRSEYLRNPVKSDTVPPLTAKLLDHMLGNDPACVERFLNWLACIVQHRKLTMSAWVLSGIQGTGKGTLFHRILSPLLGSNHTIEVQLSDFRGDFNEFVEGRHLVFIDESQTSELRDRHKVMQALKSLVSEETITVHRKHCNRYKTANRANFILASNKHDPVEIDRTNRRFNVAPRQERPLVKTKVIDGIMTIEEIEVGLASELRAFAGYLLDRNTDRELLLSPIRTDAHERLAELSSTTAETIAHNLQGGNFAYFVENWPDASCPTKFRLETGVSDALTYEQLLNEFSACIGKPMNVPIKMVHALFYYLDGATQHPAKFANYMRHLGLDITKVSYKSQTSRGLYNIKWHAKPEIVTEWQQEHARRQQPISRRAK